MSINCKCQRYNLSSKFKSDFQKYRQEILEELLEIRKYCYALKNVFIPNKKNNNLWILKIDYFKLTINYLLPEGM